MKASGRKPLQPKNIFDTKTQILKPKTPHQDLCITSKDNLLHPPIVVESSSSSSSPSSSSSSSLSSSLSLIDASLAEELNSFKKKVQRLKVDKEKTEKLLKERNEAIDLKLIHLLERGEIQKSLEIQVDRLFRLKELHTYSSKISPIQSLRTKEQKKRKSFSFETMVDVEVEETGEEITSVKKDVEAEIESWPRVEQAKTTSSSSSSSVL